jgi:tetratricopeptide (TPR) repeat protein
MGESDKFANAGRPAEPIVSAPQRRTGRPVQAASASATAPGEPPDIAKLLLSRIWNWLVGRVGPKWAIFFFVAASGLIWAWPHLSFLALVPDFVAEHLPLPKTNPNVFTVAIVPLDNDAGGQIGHDIMEGLREVRGIGLVRFERPPISDSDVSAGSARARQYLKESGAEVLIWGTVLDAGGSKVPKLYWTNASGIATKESGNYPFPADLSLPPALAKDLNELLKLLVLTQGTAFYRQEGHFIADQLAPFISRARQLLGGGAGQVWSPADTAKIRLILADAQSTLGEQSGQRQPLLDAASNYQLILRSDLRSSAPLEWARVENNLGLALDGLGEDESDTERFKQAVAAYQQALQERRRERVPLDWGMTESNLGNALADLGNREKGTEHLDQAVAAYQQAQQELTRDRDPLVWAMIENNLGSALMDIGEREPGTEHLRQAIEAYRAALRECPQDRAPFHWAVAENGLGLALTYLGVREPSDDALRQAVSALRAVLAEYARERVLHGRALTENNLGIALKELGQRELEDNQKRYLGIKHLQEAIAAYEAALEESTTGNAPIKWGLTEMNLGAALYDIGEGEQSPTEICESLKAECDAWEVFGADPYDASIALSYARLDADQLRKETAAISSGCLERQAPTLKRMGIGIQ